MNNSSGESPNFVKHDLPSNTTDALSRQALSQRVAQFICGLRPDDEGFTISIEGAWGSGKSWFLEQLRKQIPSESAAITVFSPWQIGSHQALTHGFLDLLMQQFQSQNLTPVSNLLQTISKKLKLLAASGDATISGIGATAGAINNAFESSFSELYEKLNQALREKSVRKTIVFIDDIDRLQPAEVSEVIRLVQAMGRLPNVVYVLALDVSYTENALRLAGHESQNCYLDKIIQMRVPLPPIRTKQLVDVMWSDWQAITQSEVFLKAPGGAKAAQSEGMALFHQIAQVLRNVRDWKRTYNRFRFVELGTRGHLDPTQVLAWCALEIVQADCAEVIKKERHRFIIGADSNAPALRSYEIEKVNKSLTFSEVKQSNDVIRAEFEKKFPNVSPAFWSLVISLFPKYEFPQTYRSTHFKHSIDDARSFDRLLQASEIEEYVNDQDVNDFVFDAKKRAGIRDKLNANNIQDFCIEVGKRLVAPWELNGPIELFFDLFDIEIHFAWSQADSAYPPTSKFLKHTIDQFNFGRTETDKHVKAKEILLSIIQCCLEGEVAKLRLIAKNLAELLTIDPSAKKYGAEFQAAIGKEKYAGLQKKYSERCLIILDTPSQTKSDDCRVVFWRLRYIHPETFSAIALTQERFIKWSNLMAQRPHGGRIGYDNDYSFGFHNFSAKERELLQHQKSLNQWIDELPDQPEGMKSWKTALKNPDREIRFGTCTDRHTGEDLD